MEEPKGEGSDRTESILPNFSRRNIEDFRQKRARRTRSYLTIRPPELGRRHSGWSDP